jgi:hypothetical protein
MSLIVTPQRGSTTALEIRFERSPDAASARRPEAGHCAWSDRPLNSSDPTLVRFDLRAQIWTEFRVVGTGHTSTGVGSSATDADAAFAQELLDAVRGTGCFVLNVRNSGRGYLSPTRAIERSC